MIHRRKVMAFGNQIFYSTILRRGLFLSLFFVEDYSPVHPSTPLRMTVAEFLNNKMKF